jgi:Uma2 family endonuclease
MAESRAAIRWTTADLELFPDDTRRYEIIDGELFVSKAPRNEHQAICMQLSLALGNWNAARSAGRVLATPGLIFDESDSVIPDLVWLSRERFRIANREDGHLHHAPELVVEVLSPGAQNERRDRDVKLKLYSVEGVQEYWIVDGGAQSVSVFRRQDAALRLAATLRVQDELTSPLLPGLRMPLASVFERNEPTA